MSKSSLATLSVPADKGNYTIGRNGYNICKITVHHTAGVLSAEECGKIFQKPSRKASSNYGIGNDGEIACYVEEENRAWTSSSRSNDFQAITIEVSNSEASGDYPVSDKAWNSLVNLCTDICERYNFKLIYTGDKSGSLTRHNMFANTNCPGAYLQSRFQELADTVNSRLDEVTTTAISSPVEEKTVVKKIDVKYQVYANEWYEDVVNYNETDSNGYAGVFGKAISGFRGNTVGQADDVRKTYILCASVK